MDYSSVMFDSSGHKIKDLHESVMALLDKKSLMINKELLKLKDECSSLIKNCKNIKLN